MTPKRVDVSIICAKCNRPVEQRMMEHDPGTGFYRYKVFCHGEMDDTLSVEIEGAHGKVLNAFAKEQANVTGSRPGAGPIPIPSAGPAGSSSGGNV